MIQLICGSLIFQAVQGGQKHVFLILMAVSIFCEGGHFVLMSSNCAQVFGSSKRGVKAFSLLFSSFGLCSFFSGLVCGKMQSSLEDPFKHVIQVAQLLTTLAILNLICYDRILKTQSGNSDDPVLVTDDLFKRINSDNHNLEDIEMEAACFVECGQINNQMSS